MPEKERAVLREARDEATWAVRSALSWPAIISDLAVALIGAASAIPEVEDQLLTLAHFLARSRARVLLPEDLEFEEEAHG